MRLILRAVLGVIVVVALALLVTQLWNSRGSPRPDPVPGALRLVSMNTHYILLNAPDGPWSVAGWERRKDALTAVLRPLDADLIAFQEMESFQRGGDGSVNLARDHLLATMPGFAVAASGDWRSFPTTQPILYRPERLNLLDQGWFFFSDTPDVIYSRTFNGSYPAFASWAWFEDHETGERLRVVNVHFDYSSAGNRLASAALVAERLSPWLQADERVVLVGDLNAMAGSRTAGILRETGLALTPARGATYHLNRGLNLFGAIDHVLHDCNIRLDARPVAIREKPGNVWPSDHYPVLAQFHVGLPSTHADCRNLPN